MSEWLVYVDGGSRGNPGCAGVGVVVQPPAAQRTEISEWIGACDNNYAEYAGLAVLTARALNRGGRGVSLAAAVGAAAIAYAYGVTDETHQFFVPGRDASLHDLRSDLAGSMLGALAIYILGRNFRPSA